MTLLFECELQYLYPQNCQYDLHYKTYKTQIFVDFLLDLKKNLLYEYNNQHYSTSKYNAHYYFSSI